MHAQHGEAEADVSRRTTTEDSSAYGGQATARPQSNSPHAAAASRRFLVPASHSFRGAGAHRPALLTYRNAAWPRPGIVLAPGGLVSPDR